MVSQKKTSPDKDDKSVNEPLSKAALVDQMNAFRLKGQFCDVTVLLTDGKTFRGHKMVLAAASAYFEKQFNGGFPDSDNDVCKFTSLDSGIAEAVLEFIYTGKIDLNTEVLSDIWAAADFLLAPELINRCLKWVEANLSVCKFEKIQQLASFFESSALKCLLEKFMLRIWHESHKECLQLPAQLIKEFLLNEEVLRIRSEKKLVKFLVDWFCLDPEEHVDDLIALLKHVRWDCLPTRQMVKLLLENQALAPVFGKDTNLKESLQSKVIQKKFTDKVDIVICVVAGQDGQPCVGYVPSEDQWVKMGKLPHLDNLPDVVATSMHQITQGSELLHCVVGDTVNNGYHIFTFCLEGLYWSEPYMYGHAENNDTNLPPCVVDMVWEESEIKMLRWEESSGLSVSFPSFLGEINTPSPPPPPKTLPNPSAIFAMDGCLYILGDDENTDCYLLKFKFQEMAWTCKQVSFVRHGLDSHVVLTVKDLLKNLRRPRGAFNRVYKRQGPNGQPAVVLYSGTLQPNLMMDLSTAELHVSGTEPLNFSKELGLDENQVTLTSAQDMVYLFKSESGGDGENEIEVTPSSPAEEQGFIGPGQSTIVYNPKSGHANLLESCPVRLREVTHGFITVQMQRKIFETLPVLDNNNDSSEI